jgi:hypothetical protein
LEGFALNPRLDADALAEEYVRTGMVSVADVLTAASAAGLYASLRARDDWRQVIGNDDRLVELDRPTRQGLTGEQREQLDLAVYAGARSGFQYRYETIRVPDDDSDRAASSDPLAAFARWWSGGEVRDMFRRITGSTAIAFADVQATAYAPGDFLTAHDDDVAGKNRVAAYVLNLTPQWRLEWGGLLAFHDDAQMRGQVLVPDFNRLNLFQVPQRHSVTEVTRAAPYRRYSITGWLRR